MPQYNIPAEVADWVKAIGCAVTICDHEGKILYMNDRARATYAHRGNLIGYNLFDCHNDRSKDIIRRLLSTGETNTYTVQKNGIKKLIFQTPWRDEAGNIAGLAELSIPLPTDLPHYNRDAQ